MEGIHILMTICLYLNIIIIVIESCFHMNNLYQYDAKHIVKQL